MTGEAVRRGKVKAGTSKTIKRPFGAIVRDLLIEREITTGIGNPNWNALAAMVPDVSYESLRKAITNERHPSPKIMEGVAQALGVSPSIFWEYNLWEAQRSFDPREVGEDTALANLEKWVEERGA